MKKSALSLQMVLNRSLLKRVMTTKILPYILIRDPRKPNKESEMGSSIFILPIIIHFRRKESGYNTVQVHSAMQCF